MFETAKDDIYILCWILICSTSTPAPPGTGTGTPTPGTGTGTPGTGTGTPGTGTGTGTPGTGTGTGTPGTGTGTGVGTPGSGTGTGTGNGINVNPPIFGPTGANGFDNSGSSISIHQITNLLTHATFLGSGLILFRLI